MLKKIYRLRKNRDFRKIYKYSKPLANKYLVMYFKRTNSENTRIGFSISKKIGKANQRNLLKRRLREIVKINLSNIKNGYDIIFVARKNINEITYKEINNSLINLLKKGNLLK